MASSHDIRFIREGRPFRDWMWDLLAPDPLTRRLAENAVSAMHWGTPTAGTDLHQHLPRDLKAHQADFGRHVAESLESCGPEGTQFIRNAIATYAEDQDGWLSLSKLEDGLIGLDDELEQWPTEGSAEFDRLRAEWASRTSARELGKLPNSSGPYILQILLENAGPTLLLIPDLVKSELAGGASSTAIAKGLANLGSAGAPFAGDLLDLLDSSTDEQFIRYPDTLAAIGGKDPGVIRRLVDRIRHRTGGPFFGACETLRAIGTSAGEMVPTLVDELLPQCNHADRGHAILMVVGTIGSDRRDVLNLVLHAARPSPPIWRRFEISPGQTFDYDEVNYRRGSAINLLGGFTRFADQVIPVLIDAIETFEEYDPDWGYQNGEHGRVISALSKFGSAAAPAVPALLPHLRDSEGNVDWRVVRFFGEIGPAAHATLPALEALRGNNEPLYPDPSDPVADPLGWAIGQIRVAADRT